MMNSPVRIVVDTNILFMSIYGSDKAQKVINAAINNKIILFSPISVKEELTTVIKREFSFLTEENVEFIVKSLPVIWIEKEIYESEINKTTVKKKGDKAVEALSLILNCGILTADTDFDNVKQKIDINQLLAQLDKKG